MQVALWILLLCLSTRVLGEIFLNGSVAVRIFNSTIPLVKEERDLYTNEASILLTRMGFQIISAEAVAPSSQYGADHYMPWLSPEIQSFT